MSNIENTTNVMVYTDLVTNTDFYQSINVLNKPDACIIRDISYSGVAADLSGIYFIWCDIANDFIGSFVVNSIATQTNAFSSSPQSHITFGSPLTNVSQVHFTIFYVSSGTKNVLPCGVFLAGKLSINMDFVKYKK